MERRAFFRAGLAAGVTGLATAPSALALAESPTRRAGPLRLNSNENPLGLAPAARQAVIDGIAEANRYPFSARPRLVRAIAERHSTTPSHIVLGNGSTEILRIAVAALAGPDRRVIIADPTFENIAAYSRPFPYTFDRVPLTGDYAHDLGRMRDLANATRRACLAYICNPNNPTGTLTDCAAVAEWIAEAPERVFFVVDEAYFEFVEDAGYWSFDRIALERPNVLVVRTFSKIFGMAGMRAGYGIAHPDVVRVLRAHVTRNTPNHLAQVAALASLEDGELIARSRDTNARARQVLHGVLDELSLEYLPSHTNFVMHRISGELRAYIDRMRAREIQVGRPFPPMLGYNRLSLGLPAEMEEFAEALRDFRRQGWI